MLSTKLKTSGRSVSAHLVLIRKVGGFALFIRLIDISRTFPHTTLTFSVNCESLARRSRLLSLEFALSSSVVIWVRASRAFLAFSSGMEVIRPPWPCRARPLRPIEMVEAVGD
jgi:hypothetical protein